MMDPKKSNDIDEESPFNTSLPEQNTFTNFVQPRSMRSVFSILFSVSLIGVCLMLGFSMESVTKLASNFYQPEHTPFLKSVDETNLIQAENLKLTKNKIWCVIDPDFLPKNVRLYFDHFPHALEVILQCYSHFIETNAIIVGKTDAGVTFTESNCGFMISVHLATPATMSKYIAQVLPEFGCNVQYFVDQTYIPETDIIFKNNMYKMTPTRNHINYVNKPEHAHYLRRKFVPDSVVEEVKGKDKPLQIGLLNRIDSRRILNLGTEILDLFKETFPDSNVTYTDFNYTTVKDQATWFATKDVIVAPHGAALTNSLFITPGTIVLQTYPTGYYMNSLEPLIDQVGGIALQWTEKGINPYYEYYKDLYPGQKSKDNNMTIPPEEIVLRVKYALGAPNVSEMSELFGDYGVP